MKNREKFAKEILDIACKGYPFSVTKSGEITFCDCFKCDMCKFYVPADSFFCTLLFPVNIMYITFYHARKMSAIPHSFVELQTFTLIFYFLLSGFYTAAALSKISFNAAWLLVWHLIIFALARSASTTAQRAILCDTVLVNKITKSGLPIWLDRFALICVNTFALHLCSLQIFLY